MVENNYPYRTHPNVKHFDEKKKLKKGKHNNICYNNNMSTKD
jgi:hypothetical protein